ncbi:hypothetical protein NQ318_007527 [Aromia moschata]|uniref:DDE Tnp4 domain-containing protein n=1 Tax=Aromia moschata TaxID=1265417 RepID=A0AAV8YF80_9CUCU|nr:hypothetical protein NQ318_007527 [Aromia moschata]
MQTDGMRWQRENSRHSFEVGEAAPTIQEFGNECSLKRKFLNGEIQGILTGDNGYPSSRHLLTPVLNPTTNPEEEYNRAHIRTRNVIERTFGIMKNKFSFSMGERPPK